MSGWQPIESAPKDGTEILVCMTHNTPDGGWETIQWVDWQCAPYIWPRFMDRVDIPFAPTHWMSLPAPPDPTPDDGEVG
jgi:hypothetical protein